MKKFYQSKDGQMSLIDTGTGGAKDERRSARWPFIALIPITMLLVLYFG